ncbi:MAG: methyltransferase domain-containing protein [Planctomycetes bacterium]|nr:methyltransferase domain-containing protein [Planctomycetota bacterium]
MTKFEESNDAMRASERGEAAPVSPVCCGDSATWRLPGLKIPQVMLAANFGGGANVQPADLAGDLPIAFIGVGSGQDALQFAYFRRRRGGVIAIEPIAEMRETAERYLEIAARENPWFDPTFVIITDGAADAMPIESASLGLFAQNCLFSIFDEPELRAAHAEVVRVLAPGGLFATSDAVAQRQLPESFINNPSLRARCFSRCATLEQYLLNLADAGFGQLVVRRRAPHRLLSNTEFAELESSILLENADVLAIKSPRARAEVFTGRHAINTGPDAMPFGDRFAFIPNIPYPVSDETAQVLAARRDFIVTAPTYDARTPGCC